MLMARMARGVWDAAPVESSGKARFRLAKHDLALMARGVWYAAPVESSGKARFRLARHDLALVELE